MILITITTGDRSNQVNFVKKNLQFTISFEDISTKILKALNAWLRTFDKSEPAGNCEI